MTFTAINGDNSMKKKICITILFSLLLLGAAFFVSGLSKEKTGQDARSEEILEASFCCFARKEA